MREIKFRCWDKANNEMFQVGRLDFEKATGNLVESNSIMQFTGLKDKNGKEIYEGDIIRVVKGYENEIVWNEKTAAFCVRYFDDGKEKFSDHLFGGEICEVIGNIWEHSHLLVKK